MKQKQTRLTHTQINMLLERMTKNFNSKNDIEAEKLCKLESKQRRAKLEELLASVPTMYRKDMITALECVKLKGMSEHRPAWNIRYENEKKFKSMLYDLKFELTMCGAEGYKEVVAAFEGKVAKLFK